MTIDNDTKFLIELKWSSLRRNCLATITYDQVERTLLNTKWKNGQPTHLCYIAQDVSELTIEDVVNYLTKERITSEFTYGDLLNILEGGNDEERKF